MPAMTDQAVRTQRSLGPLLILAVVLGLAGLPLAVWLDLRNLSDRLEDKPASFILGREAPKEFEPR